MDTVIEQFCSECNDNTQSRFVLTPEKTHYGKLVCERCGRYRRWISKPESDATKYRRPNAHSDLVAKFNRGFCEMCMRSDGPFEAHHVIEYQDGGDATKENIWILCVACHRLVTWVRKYVGRNAPLEELIADVAKEIRVP